ncbi:hypothetical protein BDP27DRAFT_1142312, partial [Rhodocollybia butyracea]
KLCTKFFENGWFVLLCRHMILMLTCDMVKSGELYQYPLALLAIYMAAEKEEWKLANAYDIHCKFLKHLQQSPLQSLAEWAKYLPVIGTMHGYAHKRLCQLIFLMLYIIGIGLEDGEVCEQLFSISNALTAITHHQSAFHRHQSISEFL